VLPQLALPEQPALQRAQPLQQLGQKGSLWIVAIDGAGGAVGAGGICGEGSRAIREISRPDQRPIEGFIAEGFSDPLQQWQASAVIGGPTAELNAI